MERFRGLICCFAVFLLFCFSASAFAQPAPSDPSHQQFLFAYKLLQRGENQLAVEAFDEYLTKFPDAAKRGDAMYFSALLYRRLGQPAKALAKLADAPATQLVDADAVALLRGQLLVDTEQYAAALKPLEQVQLKDKPAAVAVSVLYLKGLAYRGTGNLDAAAAMLRQASELDTPMRDAATLDLARTLVLAKKPDDALKLLAGLMQSADPAAATAAARLGGDLSYQRKNYDQAVTFYEAITSRRQSSIDFAPAVMGTLWAHHAAGKPEQVIAAYDRFAKALVDKNEAGGAAYLAALAYQKLGRHAEVVKLLTPLVDAPSPPALADQLLYRLAMSQYELAQYGAMEQTIMRLLAAYPKTPLRPDAMFLLASADGKQGNAARGVARLTEIVDQGVQHPYFLPSLLQRARLYEENHKLAAAIADYNRYLENCDYERLAGADGKTLFKPTDTQAKILLRLLDLTYRSGEFDQTEQIAAQWFRIMQLPPAIEQEALYRLALAQVKRNENDQAIATLTQLNRKYPVHRYQSEANYYLGLLRTTQGQPGEAAAYLRQAAAAKQLSIPLRVNALRLLFLHDRDAGDARAAADALMQIEQLQGRAALSVEDLNWLGAYLVGQRQPQDALAYLNEALTDARRASLAEQGTAEYWRGRALFAQGRNADALAAFEAAEKAGRGPVGMATLWKGRVQLATGHAGDAVATLTPLSSDEDPAVASAALLTLGRASIEQAQAARRRDDAAARTAALEQARRFLKRLVLLYPSPALSPAAEQGYVLLAETERALGLESQSVATLDELIDKFSGSGYATLGRAMKLRWQGQDAPATAMMRQLADQTQDRELKAMTLERVEQ